MVLENPDIYLIAGFNEGYLRKSMTYLETMNRYSNVNNIIVTLDFDIVSELRERLNKIKFVRINYEQVKSPNSNKCMQHGAFLEVLDFIGSESIIIFTDTDITIQRPFTEPQLQLLRSCQDGDVFVNLNMSEEQTLLEDIKLWPANIATNELIKKYPEFPEFRSYNTGVICTKHKTYKQLYQKYNQYWSDFSHLFDAYVKQQMLLSYLIQKYFHLRSLPYIIHSQAYSLPIKKCSNKKRIGYIGEKEAAGFKLCIDFEVVVFNHHIKHESVLIINQLQKKTKRLYKIISFLIVVIIVLLVIVLT
jgi:hypothetical protein